LRREARTVHEMASIAGTDLKKTAGSVPEQLYSAIVRNDAEAIAALLREGSFDLEKPILGHPPEGATPLVIASSKGKAKAVATLLAHGARVDSRDKQGMSALAYAARAGPPGDSCVYLLLGAGADPNSVDESGYSPCHEACRLRTNELLPLPGAPADYRSGGLLLLLEAGGGGLQS
jgi:ankyrin repeat protein